MLTEKHTNKKCLVITTLDDDAEQNKLIYNEICQYTNDLELITTKSKKITHCIGCNDCWIKTPGICKIHDDYEQILIKMLQSDIVIFITEVNMGFVCSRMKNLIDRVLPLMTMHLKFKDGQMRHYSRYDKMPAMSFIYSGEADNDYLNLWLNRVQVNLHGASLGAYEFDNREALYHALTDY